MIFEKQRIQKISTIRFDAEVLLNIAAKLYLEALDYQ